MRNSQQAVIAAAWVIVVALFATVMVAQPLERRVTLATMVFKFSTIAFLASLVGWLIWAVCKSARVAIPAAVYNGLVIATALFFLGIYAGGAASTRLQLEEQQTIRIGPELVQIHGTISHDLAKQLRALIHPSLQLQRVHLNSSGGSVAAAIDTADLLMAQGVRSAIIEGECASACAIMALAFPQRYLTDGATLGFHALSALGTSQSQLAQEREMLLFRFAHNGISRDTLRPLFAGREMHYPDRAWLLEHGLVTGCWDYDTQAPRACVSVP